MLYSATLQQYFRPILVLFFQRLQGSSTPKFVSHMLQALSVVVHKHGVETLIAAMDQVQSGYEVGVLSRPMRSGSLTWLRDFNCCNGSSTARV